MNADSCVILIDRSYFGRFTFSRAQDGDSGAIKDVVLSQTLMQEWYNLGGQDEE
jgi:hypothetical protein